MYLSILPKHRKYILVISIIFNRDLVIFTATNFYMKKQVPFFLILMMMPMLLLAQHAPAPTNKEATYAKAMHSILQTRYINSKGTPTAPEDRVRIKHNEDVFFYLWATVVSIDSSAVKFRAAASTK